MSRIETEIKEFFTRTGNVPADYFQVAAGIKARNIHQALSRMLDDGVLETVQGKNIMLIRLKNYPPQGGHGIL